MKSVGSTISSLENAANIFREHGEFIRKVIQGQVQDDALAEDIFQDFFISLVNHPLWEANGDLRVQIYRALVNDVIDAGRRDKRYKHHIFRHAQFKTNIADNCASKPVIEEDAADHLFDSIRDHVSQAQANAITLRYKDDKTIEEVGHELGVNNRSVSRYISVGLKKLRTIVGKEVV